MLKSRARVRGAESITQLFMQRRAIPFNAYNAVVAFPGGVPQSNPRAEKFPSTSAAENSLLSTSGVNPGSWMTKHIRRNRTRPS